jgi:hypothetical protein
MVSRETGPPTDAELQNLRSKISDLGSKIDARKTKTAGALGGGVFALLLAAGAAYDLIAGKSGVWLTLGITRESLIWAVCVLGAASFLMLSVGIVLIRTRDRGLSETLEELEQEYAALIESKRRG